MEDRTELNAYFREYYKNHKEKHLAAVRKWRENNPEKFKASIAKTQTPEFKAKRSIYLKEWKKNNRDKVLKYNETKRLKVKAARESLDPDQSSES